MAADAHAGSPLAAVSFIVPGFADSDSSVVALPRGCSFSSSSCFASPPSLAWARRCVIARGVPTPPCFFVPLIGDRSAANRAAAATNAPPRFPRPQLTFSQYQQEPTTESKGKQADRKRKEKERCS